MKNNIIKSEYTSDDIFSLNTNIFNELRKLAQNDITKRSRILLHSNQNSQIHEMLIAFEKGSYVRPHKHIGKSESYLILYGKLDLIYFNDDGKIIKKFELQDNSNETPFYFRSENDQWHTINIISDYVILLETTNGPVENISTIFADWAPDPNEIKKVELFQKNLLLF